MRVLILGGAGQVGSALGVRLGAQCARPARTEADLTDEHGLHRLIASENWDAVVNCAAFTNVDGAEQNSAAAQAVNADGAGRLAAATQNAGVPLIHLSTDYVFDGSKGSPYREDDPVAPLGVYGRTKAAGEQAVRSATHLHMILRTSWIFGPAGGNFVKTMLRLAETRDQINVVSDQWGNPTASDEVARAVIAMIGAVASGRADAPYGTYHFAGAGSACWADFAERIFEQSRARGGLSAIVSPISTADYGAPAPRPANSCLDSSLFSATFGTAPRLWTETLSETLDQLLGQRVRSIHPATGDRR